ncbi:heavy-metal-associated domain-containing protein [Corynebacterium freiburgense]|uniref:heavy-metal-associated domain-containing protein n=1 Tax=Corynebacterium freiburgense TaxID=556548 RepID=UPI000400423E|nr:cation transporter [Corynebacterium freiburgense]WJZ03918.1 Copper chaperone CopZ [Corynebacterium freiburgense]
MTTKTYTVSGMTCGHCAQAVKEEISALAGIEGVEVDVAAGTVSVSGADFTDAAISEAVEEAGYTVVS